MVYSKTESKSPKVSKSTGESLISAAEGPFLTKLNNEVPTVEMPTKTGEKVETSLIGPETSAVEVSVEVKEMAVDTDSLSAIEKTSRSITNGKTEGPDGMYQPGSRLEAMDMSTNKWYGVKVVEVDWDEREVLIHFEKWSQRFDEWIPMNSSRLRPIGDRMDIQADKPSGYRVGETVMATWSDCRKYPARVKAILSGDLVEVLFFDGFLKRMKLSKIAKCVGDQGIEPPPGFVSPSLQPGPAALMSKAERRERKRKIPTVVELFQCKKTSKKVKESSDSPRHVIGSPPVDLGVGSETEKSKAKYADLTVSDNEGEKTYIDLDTSFKEEDAAVDTVVVPSGKSKGKAKTTDNKKGSKVEKRKRSYNKVFLDDSPVGTYRETFPFKGRRSNEAISPNDYDNWEPEGQEAYVVETSDGLRRSIIVSDDRLPEGWAKHTIQRRSGNSAGKWDVFLVSPTGRRFRSRKEMVTYFQDSGSEYKPELFDFTLRGLCKRHVCNMMRKRADTVHVKKANKKQKPSVPRPKSAVVAGHGAEVSAVEDVDQHRRVKTLLPKAPSQQRGEGLSTPPPPPHHPCTLAPPPTEPDALPLDDGKVYVGTMEIQMQDNALVCPKEGCLKHFRRENLLQMHMKHYHPEYNQFLGSTPNVADLAYARTVGEPIEDIVPPSRTLAVAVNRFEASKKAKQLAAMSPPQQQPTVTPELKKMTVGETRKSTKTYSATELIASPPVAKDLLGGTPVDLEQFIKPMKCPTVAQSTPLRDLLRGPKLGLTAGIKTLLPSVRTSPKDGAQKKVGDDWLGFPAVTGVARIRKRRLSDNVEQNTAKKKKLAGLDDSPSCRGQQGMKKKTPILAATLALPVLDALDPSEPIGSPLTAAELAQDQLNKIDIINCTCGVMEEDGLMIQCDLCLCWQHGYCNSIEHESQVPDKYVCAICLHPARQRTSMRHLHDQAWLKEGTLPSLLATAQPQPTLAASHDLTATLLEIKHLVHSLRVKVNIADSADHPKLYLWAKPWQKDTFLVAADGKQTQGERRISADSTLPQTDSGEKQDCQLDSQLLLQALTSGSATNEWNNDAVARNQLLHFPICQSELMRFAHSMADNLKVTVPEAGSAPEPEKPIDPVECRLLLLDHIQHHQLQVKDKLQRLEDQIAALEEEEGGSEETATFFPQTKQTIKMLLRDLTTVRNIAAIN